MSHAATLAMYDGVPCQELRARAGAAHLVAVAQCASTMDLAHVLAADGALHGTAVVAEEQHAGRGRTGKRWSSSARHGVWVSVVLREALDAATGVLSLRAGITLARALDARADGRVQLKWPNDLYVADAKLAGILTEARWRGDALEWIVVGVGVNVGSAVAALPDADRARLVGARLCDVLVDVIRSVLSAAAERGPLTPRELAEFDGRDLAKGRSVTAPLAGVVTGITDTGGVRVMVDGIEQVAVAGSLVFGTS